MKRKRQHFVPRFYFRFFSKDGTRIHLLHRATGKIIEHVSIREQCAESYFYGPQSLEDKLESIERNHVAVLNKCRSIDSLLHLSSDDQRYIREATIVQKTRTRAEAEHHRPSQDRYLRLTLMKGIESDRSLNAEAKRKILNKLNKVRANYRYYITLGILISLESVILMEDLTIYLLENRTKHPFIFGDAPVIMSNYWGHKILDRSMLGFQIQGIQIFFPIGPWHCLMIIDDEKYGGPHRRESRIYELTNPTDVDHLNKFQIHNAFETIYFSEEKEISYVEQLFFAEKPNLQANLHPVKEGILFDSQGRLIGSGTHMYEPFLPYMANLSFLECSPIAAADYKTSLRNQEIANRFLLAPLSPDIVVAIKEYGLKPILDGA